MGLDPSSTTETVAPAESGANQSPHVVTDGGSTTTVSTTPLTASTSVLPTATVPTPVDSGAIAAHYERGREAILTVGSLSLTDEAPAVALGNYDFYGWYRDAEAVEVLPEDPDELPVADGFTRAGRGFRLTETDWPALTDDLERTLYATVNYQPPSSTTWGCYGRLGQQREWLAGTNPLPNYGDLTAYAAIADIDLAQEHKTRPLAPETRATVEAALGEYIDGFANLVGGAREPVFVLDSVGGAYVFLAPAVTAPLAAHVADDPDAVELVFDALTDRLNDAVDDLTTRVNARVPDVAGVFEADCVNNNNRLYKAPLALHKTIDGVVHPLSVPDHGAAVSYDFVPVDGVSDALINETAAWGEAFTDPSHAEYAGALVTALWPEYDHHDDWRGALDAFIADECATDDGPQDALATGADRSWRPRPAESDVGGDISDSKAEVRAAIQAIDVREVAREFADAYDTAPGRIPVRFAAPWHPDHDTGTACFVTEDYFIDMAESGAGGDAVTLVARAKGYISDFDDSVKGEAFRQTLADLRALGYDIPDANTTVTTEYVVERSDFDQEVASRPAPGEWDWRSAHADDGLAIEGVRDRTTNCIAEAYRGQITRLVEALPAQGKTYGAIKAVIDTGTPVTLLMDRGRKEQYAACEAVAAEVGLEADEVYRLPAFAHDCPTMQRDDDDLWYQRFAALNQNGASPAEIHKYAERRYGETPPCQCDGRCPYSARWDFEPSDYALLIGHYTHAYAPTVTQGRAVVLDEFPSAYERTLTTGVDEHQPLDAAVTRFLRDNDELPYDGYAELLEGRHDRDRRQQALAALGPVNHLAPDESQPFRQREPGHVLAPLVVASLLLSAARDGREGLGNGWEHATLGHGRVVAFTRQGGHDATSHEWHLLAPPDWDATRCVVGLDGFPTIEMWRAATGLGHQLQHESVLQDDAERRAYVTDVLGHTYVRTTDAVKPYSARPETIRERVNLSQDLAVLGWIREEEGLPADGLISSKSAIERVYAPEGVFDDAGTDGHDGRLVNGHLWHGNVLGSNQFDSARRGVVIGSRHFGDDFVQKWAAFCDEAVYAPDRSAPANRGTGLDYGPLGNRFHRHMREHETAQAVMRFGRDGDGARVYVHTNTLPEWMDETAIVAPFKPVAPCEAGVIQALQALDEGTTAEVCAHECVDHSQSHTGTVLSQLADAGVVNSRRDPADRRRILWELDAEGLRQYNPFGSMNLWK